VVGGGGASVVGGVVGGVVEWVVGGEVGGSVAGALGATGAAGVVAAGAVEPGPEDGGGVADPEPQVVTAPGVLAPTAGVGGPPAGGAPNGMAAAAAAVVGVVEPVGPGATAATRVGLAAAEPAGVPDASTATITNVALVLIPVASRRLAAAGRERFRVILRYRQPDATG
jgi:hypothetical protein